MIEDFNSTSLPTARPSFDFTFIFQDLNGELASIFDCFWEEHERYFAVDLNSYRTIHDEELRDSSSPISQQNQQDSSLIPAALALSSSGKIIGAVFVKLVAMDVSLLLGSHSYHQLMYIQKENRKVNFYRLAHPLYQTFLNGFLSDDCPKDSRAGYLLAYNVNPDLYKPSMRRYFAKMGFQLLGKHSMGPETWILPLAPSARRRKGLPK